ncbi:tetratricopeptide repeat protein [Thiorhodovibrio frisius]|uniref:Sel1 repeat protein n=1 Tax=Thiorhodovibrio frisius TaxID=631362 RepID=H8YXP5_9GAMM|nr:SEL1-like repeat protein [Thiorhodovibrio frisius]EIC23221.1 Sel1 repeat protein [Thiorhodovibrio frisius]WPL23702.1 Polar organelle development protein [Thiorhodovibrio frisius]
MPAICLKTAAAVTGLTKRTLWRYIENGKLNTEKRESEVKTLVDFDSVLRIAELEFPTDNYAMILDADAGTPAAECEFGLWLLENRRETLAVEWLQRAAHGGVADAMQWLSQLYARGQGVEQDEAQAVAWLKQAAAHGHLIAQGQMTGLGL